jgi:DHA1 family multidrug resistance protein-like MFS transporter
MTINFSALPVWVNFQLHQGQHLGLILGAFMLTEAIFRPSLGALSDRIGRKPLMLVGPALGIFTSIATIYTVNPVIMVLLRGIDGVGLAAFWPAAFAAIGDAVDEKSRSMAMSVLNSSSMAGMALAFPLGGLANDLTRSHWGAFVVGSVIFAITVITGLLILPSGIHKHEHIHEEAQPHMTMNDEVKSLFRSVPDMLVMSVVVFFAIGLLMPIIKLYAMEQFGMTETKFGMLLMPVAAALGVMAVPFGRLADKWGKMVSVGYGMLTCCLSIWFVAMVRNIFAAAGAGAILGVGFAVAFPAWMAVVSLAAPKEKAGQVMGAVGMAQGIGAMTGTALGSFIYATDWMSLPRLGVMNKNLPFYLCALFLSIGTVMVFTWISKSRTEAGMGRKIEPKERKSIVFATIIGALVICGWVVFRYTKPVAPDRVAWLWVQSAVRGDAEKAEKYTLPSFEKAGQDITASEMAANVYSRWSKKEKAYYIPPSNQKFFDKGQRSEVRVVFVFPDRRRVADIIVLQKLPSGEWKVAGKHAARK